MKLWIKQRTCNTLITVTSHVKTSRATGTLDSLFYRFINLIENKHKCPTLMTLCEGNHRWRIHQLPEVSHRFHVKTSKLHHVRHNIYSPFLRIRRESYVSFSTSSSLCTFPMKPVSLITVSGPCHIHFCFVLARGTWLYRVLQSNCI